MDRESTMSRAGGRGLRAAAAVAAMMALGALMPQGAAAFEPKVEVDRPLVARGDASPIYLRVELAAPASAKTDGRKRPPLNLAIVLDRSGSMADKGKIEYLRTAAGLIVDQLTERDHLAVVEYDDQITVLWPSARVSSPTPIKKLIEALDPRGSTNLTGGMMKGTEEVIGRLATGDQGEGAISRVLLLSDGLANQGVTDPVEIRRLVRGAKDKGARISTMGLGRDYDENLMQAIAENGGGTYYYIEHPTQMARIFERELDTLFATVIRKAKLEIDATKEIERIDVLTFDEASGKARAELDLGEFYAKETRTFIVKLTPKAGGFGDLGPTPVASLTLGFENVETGESRTVSVPVTVDVIEDRARADAARNEAVVIETALLETEMEQRAAVDLYEKGDSDAADKVMASLNARVAGLAAQYDDPRLKVKEEALRVEQSQMVAAAAAPEAKADYLKSSKQRLYQAKTGNRALYGLKLGDQGFEVEELQRALEASGFYKGPIDGLYDEDVRKAVEAYQGANNLTADGIAGPATNQALGLY